jgi:hypothetical protein
MTDSSSWVNVSSYVTFAIWLNYVFCLIHIRGGDNMSNRPCLKVIIGVLIGTVIVAAIFYVFYSMLGIF